MSDLKLLNFLYGENLLGKANSTFKPGTIYLDVTTGELFFDDPSKETVTKHNKIIDTETLIYVLDDESQTVTFPSTGDEDASIPGGGNVEIGSGGTTTIGGKATFTNDSAGFKFAGRIDVGCLLLTNTSWTGYGTEDPSTYLEDHVKGRVYFRIIN